MKAAPLVDNVLRKDNFHVAPAGIVDGIDVSAKKQSWKCYLWDSWDKSPEVKQ